MPEDAQQSSTEQTPLLRDTETPQAHDDPNQGLRRVPDSLPLSAWSVGVAEVFEKFAFFSVMASMQNYLQEKADNASFKGGMGLSQSRATMVNQAYIGWTMSAPIIGAVMADQYLGRVRTVVSACSIYFVGLAMLTVSSTPFVKQLGLGFPGLVFSLLMVGLGAGGIRPNVSPLVAEQYVGPEQDDGIKTLHSGERVVLDRDLTIQRIFSIFLIFVNVGAVSGSITPLIEQRFGFTPAFFVTAVMFLFGYLVLLYFSNRYTTAPPRDSILVNVGSILFSALRHGGFDGAAEAASDPSSPILNKELVSDARQTLQACKILLFFPFYWAANLQGLTNMVAQGKALASHGIPNDAMAYINPLFSIFLIPLLELVVYPFLRNRLAWRVSPQQRIVAGFATCSLAMVYVAVLQRAIYASPPCFERLGCDEPSRISILWQVPPFVLICLSELLASLPALEYIFNTAPPSMRSLVNAAMYATSAVGSFIGIAFASLAVDPLLPRMYELLAVMLLVAGMGFAVCARQGYV